MSYNVISGFSKSGKGEGSKSGKGESASKSGSKGSKGSSDGCE
eukprot:CAMPEP_0172311136 /NCGR_PEP_ID=MMETSP1058-20130122/13862_1 /TAXON_ID=83371 /ORGANISM="Detonula confervacea, Strain CCMP 353" /LENGTH=42 /DNA_ID= /DNA_START= /DNA_END= /DNA_ORIENTATION=